MFTVYIISCSHSGKHYVGFTGQELQGYLKQQFARAARGDGKPHLYAAIRKHGASTFRIGCLLQCPSEAVARRLEVSLITQLRACDPAVGYNILPGGEGIPKGYKFSAKARANMSKARMGNRNSVGKLSGKRNGMFGKTHTAEARAIQAEACRLAWTGRRHRPETVEKIRRAAINRKLVDGHWVRD